MTSEFCSIVCAITEMGTYSPHDRHISPLEVQVPTIGKGTYQMCTGRNQTNQPEPQMFIFKTRQIAVQTPCGGIMQQLRPINSPPSPSESYASFIARKCLQMVPLICLSSFNNRRQWSHQRFTVISFEQSARTSKTGAQQLIGSQSVVLGIPVEGEDDGLVS